MSPENSSRLELLRAAPLNKWIALSEDGAKILAVGDSYQEVSDSLDRAGIEDSVVLKTPEEWAPLSV